MSGGTGDPVWDDWHARRRALARLAPTMTLDGLADVLGRLGWTYGVGTRWVDESGEVDDRSRYLGAWVMVYWPDGKPEHDYGGEGETPTAALREAVSDACGPVDADEEEDA